MSVVWLFTDEVTKNSIIVIYPTIINGSTSNLKLNFEPLGEKLLQLKFNMTKFKMAAMLKI